MRVLNVTSNLLELPFAAPAENRHKNPSQIIDRIGTGDNHHPLLNDHYCSKPSRWRHPPSVTREIHSKTQLPSVTKYNHSSNALGSLQSHQIMNKSKEVSGNGVYQLLGVYNISKCQEILAIRGRNRPLNSGCGTSHPNSAGPTPCLSQRRCATHPSQIQSTVGPPNETLPRVVRHRQTNRWACREVQNCEIPSDRGSTRGRRTTASPTLTAKHTTPTRA